MVDLTKNFRAKVNRLVKSKPFTIDQEKLKLSTTYVAGNIVSSDH